MDTGDATDVATVVVSIIAGLIALAALYVSYLAWKESRRSADAAVRSAKASEDSAAAAARSAVAEEAALALARRDAEHQDAERHDRAGPEFVPVTGELCEGGRNNWTAVAELRVDGGPDQMHVRIELVADTSFEALLTGMHVNDERETLDFDVVPGATLLVRAVPRWDSVLYDSKTNAPLLLRIIVTAHDEPSRQWVRRPRIDLQTVPRPRLW